VLVFTKPNNPNRRQAIVLFSFMGSRGRQTIPTGGSFCPGGDGKSPEPPSVKGRQAKMRFNDLKNLGREKSEAVAKSASELKWRQSMLKMHVRNLERCLRFRRSGDFSNIVPELRAELAEQLLDEIARDLAGVLRAVNATRRAGQDFIESVRESSQENSRVLPGGG